MSSEKLKVFRSLGNWLREFRLYQRDTVRAANQRRARSHQSRSCSDHSQIGLRSRTAVFHRA